jgi:asparagine synthetase B (glutamine-hydrolysing)
MSGWTQNESIIGFPHLSRFRTSPTSLDVVPRIHQRCLGSSHTKTPKKWEQRYLIIPQGKLERVLIIRIVVVAMSGGVDSSVAAKLLAEKVRHVDNPLHAFAHNCSRIMTFPPYLCGTGTPGTNRALMWAVTGRRTGKMYNVCAENSTSHARWCVNLTASIHSL